MKAPDTFTIDSATGVSALQSITLEVRLSRPLRVRLWLAVKCLELAGWLTGPRVDVSAAQTETEAA